MNSKIECPFSADELKVMYQGRSGAELTEHLNSIGVEVSRPTVFRWLKAMGLSKPFYSPFTQFRIDCPFSKAKLHELYWIDQLTLVRIAELATGLLERDRPVDARTVQRWMDEAGIPRRSRKESSTVAFKQNAALYREMAKRLAEGNKGKAPTAPLTKRAASKGRRIAAKLRSERCPYETRICAAPDCQNEVTRKASHFRNPPERTFCCKAHAARMTWAIHHSNEKVDELHEPIPIADPNQPWVVDYTDPEVVERVKKGLGTR